MISQHNEKVYLRQPHPSSHPHFVLLVDLGFYDTEHSFPHACLSLLDVLFKSASPLVEEEIKS